MTVAIHRDVRRDVALVGIGCRFPGASSSTAFWEMLCRGDDRVTEFPADRFDAARFYDPKALTPGKSITKWGAFLDRVEVEDGLEYPGAAAAHLRGDTYALVVRGPEGGRVRALTRRVDAPEAQKKLRRRQLAVW